MLSTVMALSELVDYMKNKRETTNNETRAKEKTTAALLLLPDSDLNRAKQAEGRVKELEDDPLELLSDPRKEIITICNAGERN